MNYRHAFHAGNFADVVKHVALVAILLHLRKKETPFAVIDSHAGRGLYDLTEDMARRTGEADAGIARLSGLAPPLPEALARYLDLVREMGAHHYPGSPLIAARLLRRQDRLVAVEKHLEEATLLVQALAPYHKAQVEAADGYSRLGKLLPPPERRGVILIDPPFEATDEFVQLADALRTALRRFANGIFLVWYPVKSVGAADGFVGEVLGIGAARALTIDITVPAPEGRLARAGLLLVNPPFGFDTEMNGCLAAIAPALGAEAVLRWRAGEGL